MPKPVEAIKRQLSVDVEAILQKTTHINLEGDADFQDIYVDKMLFI